MKIYLSHAGADAKWAQELARCLDKEGFKVWTPLNELTPGENWARALENALESSDAMVVLLSPDAIKSQWTRFEIDYALSSPKYQNRLVSVLLKPTQDVPWILRKLRWINAAKDPATTARQIVDVLKPAAPAAA